MLSIYILVALILGELLALIGIMGIVGDLLQEASRILFGGVGVDPFWMILACTAGIYGMLWYGRYGFFEKILTVLVVLMALCFLLELVLLKPSIGGDSRRLDSQDPERPGSLRAGCRDRGNHLLGRGLRVRSIVVSEKGWGPGDLAQEKRDSFVSAAVMLLLSGAIMAVAAGTLHVMGLKLDNTVEMVRLFEPMGARSPRWC